VLRAGQGVVAIPGHADGIDIPKSTAPRAPSHGALPSRSVSGQLPPNSTPKLMMNRFVFSSSVKIVT
jgi:hypothetical protein